MPSTATVARDLRGACVETESFVILVRRAEQAALARGCSRELKFRNMVVGENVVMFDVCSGVSVSSENWWSVKSCSR